MKINPVFTNTYKLVTNLLSKEKIEVVITDKMPVDAPAAFDLHSRTLWLQKVSGQHEHISLGLIVHEVGHALFTNPSGTDLKKNPITQIFNIIEDGYQERMMSKKYPGAKDFLYDVFEEFFIKKTVVPDTSPNRVLIDILNVMNHNCKGIKYGNVKDYPIEVEKNDIDFFHTIEQLNDKRYNDRYQKYIELLEILKKYGKFEDQKVGGSGKPKKKKSESGEGSDSLDGAISKDQSSGKSEVTDKAFEEALRKMLEEAEDEGKLNDHHNKVEYTPENKSNKTTKNSGRQYEEFAIQEVSKSVTQNLIDRMNDYTSTRFNDQYLNSKKIAGLIFQKFEQKKEAKNFANSTDQKCGRINVLKLNQYKWNDDIFMKKFIQPEQKNHAYVVAIDWSGSMTSSVEPLFKYVQNLILFAEMADVEIELILFTTRGTKCLITHVLNTKKDKIKDRLQALYQVCTEAPSSYNHMMVGGCDFRLSGTMIYETVKYAHDFMYKNFDTDKKCLILLTDGEDGTTGKEILFNGQSICGIFKPKNVATTFINQFFAQEFGHKNVSIGWGRYDDDIGKAFHDHLDMKANSDKNFFVKKIMEHII